MFLLIFCGQGSQIVPRTPLALLPLGEKDKQDVLLRFGFGHLDDFSYHFSKHTCTTL